MRLALVWEGRQERRAQVSVPRVPLGTACAVSSSTVPAPHTHRNAAQEPLLLTLLILYRLQGKEITKLHQKCPGPQFLQWRL